MPNNINNLINLKPTLFTPSVMRNIQNINNSNGSFEFQNSNLSSLTTLGESGSFRYDPHGTGIKSTQQLEVNWSDFSNHTFFNSAQVKVNTAFEKILNLFPIDGTQKEYEKFFDKLTGYEKYIFDIFPKYQGYLFLSRSNSPANGTYLFVKDVAGSTYSNLTKTPNGKALMNPELNSSTFETWLYLPDIINENSILFQKLNNTNPYFGFSSYISASSTTTDAIVGFNIVSGSYVLDLSASVNKGKWNHLAFIWDRNQTEIRTKFYINQQFITQSSQIDIGYLNFDSANFYIGSGSAFPKNNNIMFVPTQTVSGAMEEFRFWHSVRTEKQRQEFSVKNVFSSEDLILYFKFNEPSGSASSIVIDSSGKGLHGTLFGTNLGIRNINSSSVAGPSPVLYEKLSNCPALLPDYRPIENLRQTLLLSASVFDQENPNLILRLIPPHFILEGQAQDSLNTEEGTITTNLDNNLLPNSTTLGNTQILLMCLYTWATFFDEIKLYLDSFANLIHVDYDNADTIANQFLQYLANKHGIQLPSLFVGASIEQFINAENIQEDYSNNTYSLQYIQNQIWRRILTNLQDIVTSKGTIHGIKSFIRATGIDPDNNFRIREYGGPTTKNLKVSRETRSETSTMLNFSASGYIRSPYLSGARIEPGIPTIRGSFLTNAQGNIIGTTNASDGLFTSGSWTYEAIYSLNSKFGNKQSLSRLMTSGSGVGFLITNLIAENSGNLSLYCRGNDDTTAPVLSMSLNVNIFDGNMWAISYGRERGDLIGTTTLSSSYFLRAAKQNFGDIIEEYVTSAFFNDCIPSQNKNIFNNITPTTNISGAWFEIGTSSIFATTPTPGLNDTSFAPNDARISTFNGKVSQIRFWSKALSLIEWEEHVRNFKSLGVENPLLNFNFATKESGSFEKIRIDASTDQQNLTSDNTGKINVFDFSQNNFHLSGSGFPLTTNVIVPKTYYYSLISPHFDEATTENKVRVRSFLNLDNILNDENAYAQSAPMYEILKSEQPTDNVKLTIDFSIVESLNQDIINIFANLDEFDNALGNPALLYSPDYPELSAIREIYFNRLSDKLNLKNLYNFYKWFDNALGNFLFQLIPRKTKFNGSSFVISSHMLERNKFEYQFYQQYLGDNTRMTQNEAILIQLITGTTKRY